MRLLADTGALLALTLRNDRHHGDAVAFLKRHVSTRFVLTELILAELVTRLRAKVSADVAAAAGHSMLESQRFAITFADADLLHAALERMAKYADKQVSLTDCASFALIDRLGLDGAFAFDRDFRDCGYRMFPETGE